MSDDTLIQLTEAAVSEHTTAVELAEFGALSAMSALEVADERLASAVQTLQRTSTALRVLRGLSGGVDTSQRILSGEAPARVTAPAPTPTPLPIDTTKPPDMGQDGRPGGSNSQEASLNDPRSGIQCPGCGKYGSIVRIDGYKGTPYSVLQCHSCNWERNV